MGLKKVGILGGGQLGRMLQEAAQRWNMPVYCMDKGTDGPAALYRSFYREGNILDYDDVMAFGKDKDVVTIEIEHVNLQALEELEKAGKSVHPNPRALGIIKNKNRQKSFYRSIGVPVPAFTTFENKTEALALFPQWKDKVPFIYKSAEMGYDGKGVRTIRSIDDVYDLDDIAGAFEQRIDIAIEVAVMIATSTDGSSVIYPPVAMYFDEENHILSEVHYPYRITDKQLEEMNSIAVKVTQSLAICGLCAFEYFISREGQVVLNEIAPRPHNSMHISMNNAVCSQFEQHLRAITGMPLGSPEMLLAGIMYNILGEEDDNGRADWQGWEQVLSITNAFVHLYGKTTIKPSRKMGHINIVGHDYETLKSRLEIIRTHFKNNKNG